MLGIVSVNGKNNTLKGREEIISLCKTNIFEIGRILEVVVPNS